jgi:hypothetical protein
MRRLGFSLGAELLGLIRVIRVERLFPKVVAQTTPTTEY